ncbi:MAG: T9SS type A sorting domain-containing protein [Bacteroidales bacterium]|nr:T9SS type A sorting domain-containing protein [Bacteroidales bacterium]
MKKTILSLIIISMFFTATAQTWTNYYDGYKSNSTLAITDSLIFVGCEGVINVYTTEGVYRYSKLAKDNCFSSNIDKDGNIWFGYFTQLLKFDGTNWTKINIDISENLYCTSLVFDKNNKLWATLEYNNGNPSGYISSFDGINWNHISNFNDTIIIQYPEQIIVDTNNIVYAGITTNANWYSGVVRISDTDTTIYHSNNSNCIIGCKHSSYLDKNNHVWFGGCYNKLVRFDGTDWHNESYDPELHYESFTAIFLDNDGNKWLGTSNGLFVQDQDSWINYTIDNELAFDKIFDIKSDLNNNIWMATSSIDYDEGCITKYADENFTHYYPNTFKGEPSKVVFRNDETWVISKDNAVSVLKNDIWEINNINETINYKKIKDITVDANNNIWMATDTALYKININNNIEIITNILGHDLISNRCLATHENNVWLNSSPYLMKFNGENWIEIDITNLPSTYFNVIQPVSTNEIWIGTNSGAMHFDENLWTTYTDASGLGSNTVRDIAVEDNKIWFATSRGVSVFDGSEFITYIQDSAFIPSYNSNSSIHIDKKGHKWIGCPKGIYRYDNYNFHFMLPNDIEEQINYITEDSQGNVWVASQYGLSKYTFAPDNIEENLLAKNTLELFPNPTKDFFQIEIDNLNKSETLKIYTISGKCIHNQTVYNGINTVKTNNLQPGIYIVKLTNSLKFAKLLIE